MMQLPVIFRAGRIIKLKISKEKLMLFLYINISIILLFTARIGSLTSNQEFTSSIISQLILGSIILSWCMDKRINSISLIVPCITIFIFMLSAVIYPDRASFILSFNDGLWSVLSVSGSMIGFFIVTNLKNYNELEKIMRISLWYQVPYFLYICIRARRAGYWIVKVGNHSFMSSYNMEVGYGMSFVAVLLIYTYYKTRYIFLLMLSILFEFLIILFGSRGAMLPLIVYLVMWFFIGKEESKWKSFGKKLSILIICFIVLFLVIRNIDMISRSINDLFLNRFNYYSRSLMRFINGDVGNATSRTVLWKPLIRDIRANLYFPLGLYADRELVGTYSHNFIVEIISNFGMFGVGVILYLGFHTVKFFRTCTDESEKMFLSVFISYSITRLMLSSSFWMERYFWIYLALLWLGIRNYKTNNRMQHSMTSGIIGIAKRSF